MENIIVIAIVALIVAAALIYVIRAKKKGVKCIGCAAANSCAGSCERCSCNCKND
ncbi:MAG: FeoB-associated Cys-rich membrane protein [Clostridia bacterium]|nr:FeoB-associated Cys-rich membrane protein [Clostridia bacterium]